MTRINTVDPGDLLDQHLMAEYRELPRIFKLAQSWLDAGRPGTIPDSYRLGKGHVRFFYDKTEWLADRHHELVKELLAREYNIQHTELLDPLPSKLWEPTPHDIDTNLSRLHAKLQAKPDFYTWHKEPVSVDWYYTLRRYTFPRDGAFALV